MVKGDVLAGMVARILSLSSGVLLLAQILESSHATPSLISLVELDCREAVSADLSATCRSWSMGSVV